MASWKKLLVSGSDIEVNKINVGFNTGQVITTSQSTTQLTGSFSGSFVGDGSGLTGLVSTLNFSGESGTGNVSLKTQTLTLAAGEGINTTASGQTITIAGEDATTSNKGIASFNTNMFTVSSGAVSSKDITLTAGSGVNVSTSAFTLGESTTLSVDSGSMLPYYSGSIFAKVSGDVLINSTGVATIQANSVALGTDTTGNYVGTITGGTGIASSGATTGEGIAHTLSVDLTELTLGNGLDAGGATTLNLDLTEVIATDGANRVLTSDGDGTLTGEANFTFNGSALTVTGTAEVTSDLTVGGDLRVNGDLTYLNVANLAVEDKFILLNSGSADPDEAGIVVDEGSGKGHGFVFDAGTTRWGFTGSLDSTATSVTPDAFAAAVVTTDIPEYQKNGNIRVTAGEIYIYVE